MDILSWDEQLGESCGVSTLFPPKSISFLGGAVSNHTLSADQGRVCSIPEIGGQVSFNEGLTLLTHEGEQ